jgi:ketol-acid reductoisomerase
MASLTSATLTDIQSFTSNVLNTAESAFKIATDKIDTGGTLSMAQMTSYQAEISKFTLIAQIMSAITKEMVDTMKGIANKIG